MLKRNKKEDKDVDLKPYTKNKRSKGLVIGMSLGVLVTIGSIVLYRSYAIYKEEKNYNIIQGVVPDFDYDVKVALTVDDNPNAEQVPDRTGSNGKHYSVEVDCQNDGKPVDGEWDYNAWNLKLDDIESGTKCDLKFASNLSDADYNEYIKEGVALRRSIYRGKKLTPDENFYKSIEEGTFADIYVGDYIETNDGGKSITWLIADIDNYLYVGSVKTHHLTIIPATPIGEKQAMISTSTIQCGYAGSNMVKAVKYENASCVIDSTGETGSILANVYNTYINCDKCTFHGHILTYSNYLTKEVDATATNNRAPKTMLGASSKGDTFTNRQLDLMSEVNVFGTTVWSSVGYDTGWDNRQYALFRLKPELINSYNGQTLGEYWLKDVVSATMFEVVGGMGDPFYGAASGTRGVRPRFLVGVPESE